MNLTLPVLKRRTFAAFWVATFCFSHAFHLTAFSQPILNQPLGTGHGYSLMSIDDKNYTNVGSLQLCITNYGMFGHGRTGYSQQGIPSAIFPAGSGIEHIFNGALWIGAIVNGTTLVSTASITGAAPPSAGQSGAEMYAPAGDVLIKRSTLINDPNYSPNAVSHQDFVATFLDTFLVVPGTTIPVSSDHHPIGAKVLFSSYAWNYSYTSSFVLLTYKIINVSPNRWDSVYTGIYTDMVVRNIRFVAPFAGAAFYNRSANGYIDSLWTMYKFDYGKCPGDSSDTDDLLPSRTGTTSSYVGIKFMGNVFHGHYDTPKTTPGFYVNFNASDYSGTDPTFFPPSNDVARYNRMSQGYNTTATYNPPSNWDADEPPTSLIKSTLKNNPLTVLSNRIEFLSAGPHTIYPGDTLEVYYAVVCAQKNGTDPSARDTPFQKTTFVRNLRFAQTTYNNNYILPSPPDAPIVHVVVADHQVTLYWNKASEASVNAFSGVKDFEGYRIYRSNAGVEFLQNGNVSISEADSVLHLIAQYDRAGDHIGIDNGFDSVRLATPIKFSGDTTTYYYKYTCSNLLDGYQYAFAVTAFDSGNAAQGITPLESSKLQYYKIAVPGTPAVQSLKQSKVGVYPNPYYGRSYSDGSSSKDKLLFFRNLPAQCTITIYTVAGQIVQQIQHNAATYNGQDISWYQKYGDPQHESFAGGEHAWDMVSKANQLAATGLYLFSVKDLNTGDVQTGRFAIIR
jgi:hypothetical protein